MTNATVPNATELMNDLRANLHAQGERVLAVQKQWMDWQTAQLRAYDTAMKSAFDLGRGAVERTMATGLETSRVVVDAFAATQHKVEA